MSIAIEINVLKKTSLHFENNNQASPTTFDNLYTDSFKVYDPSNPNGLGPSASADGFDFYKGNKLLRG